MSASRSLGVPAVETAGRARRSRWLTLPVLSEMGAVVRFFRDSEASTAGKVFLLLAVAYIVCPIDAIPDVAPVIGWLDDLGVAAMAFAYLSRVLKNYRDADFTVQGETVPSKAG